MGNFPKDFKGSKSVIQEGIQEGRNKPFFKGLKSTLIVLLFEVFFLTKLLIHKTFNGMLSL